MSYGTGISHCRAVCGSVRIDDRRQDAGAARAALADAPVKIRVSADRFDGLQSASVARARDRELRAEYTRRLTKARRTFDERSRTL